MRVVSEELTANGGSGGLGLGCTRSTGCRVVCCVCCGGLPLLRRLRFSGAGVSSLCGVKAGVNGGVCVGLCEPAGSGLPSSESLRLLVRFLSVASPDSGIPDEVGTTATFATSRENFTRGTSTAYRECENTSERGEHEVNCNEGIIGIPKYVNCNWSSIVSNGKKKKKNRTVK